MSKRSIIVTALLVPLFCSASLAQSVDDEPSIRSLKPLIGTWNKEWTVYRSEWTPREEKATGTHTWKWILDQQHIQESGSDSTGSKYLSVWSFDTTSKRFQVATFQSSGSVFQMPGDWNSRSNTFTATRAVGNGVTMTAKYVLNNRDLFQFSFVAKDESGKIYFHLQGTGKRERTSK